MFWHPLQNEDCADPVGFTEMVRALDGIVNLLLLQEDAFTKRYTYNGFIGSTQSSLESVFM